MVQSNRTWILIGVVLSIAIVVAGWLVGIQPQLAATARADAGATSLDDQNALAELELARLKVQAEALPELQSQLDSLRLSVPERLKLEAFSAELVQIAASTGVTLTAVSFSQAIPAVPAAAYAESVPAQLPIQNLVSITYTVSLIGTQEGLRSFLRGVQFSERLSIFPAFTLAQGPEATNWGMDVTGVVFVLVDPDGSQIESGSDPEGSPPDPGSSATPTPTPAPSSTPSPTPTPSG